MPDLDDPIPISALQHAIFCLRQAALIHVERLWEDNRFTAEGSVLHEAAHDPGKRTRGLIRRVTALPLTCRRLNLAGVADLVEFRLLDDRRETPFPVEYKRGKPKQHRADEVQLCAQALCLEEMTGEPVPEGALFYAETKRRLSVPFDTELRQLTEEVTLAFGAVLAQGITPPADYRANRCRACSLIEVCRPQAIGRSARGFRDRAITAALEKVEPA
ncbi:CRISPR-associated protein Cas4 [Hyphomicrobium zavarzinii]|uniref:CRISPR-associated protein Cas4 n=1 Tax=Hyphomicrobium zavarzinii TaxID=48292 RepID=UPI00036710ED|nr:CRISPR-associated protein Cas4 [Hyphomicrobium zavarzinii]